MRYSYPVFFGFFLILFGTCLPLLGQKANPGFDEKFDHWPEKLKIGGTVILGGGGELPRQADAAFVSATGKNKQVVAVVFQPNSPAKKDSAETISDLEEKFASAKSVSVLPIGPSQTSLTDEALGELTSANGLWIVADHGTTESQDKAIQQLLTSAAELVDRGGIVCVNGKLTERLGQHAVVKANDLFAGTNIIPDTILKTDFNDKDRGGLMSALAKHERCVGIGICPNTAVVLRGRQMRLYGDEAATFCLADSDKHPERIKQLKRAKSRRANRYDTVFDLTAWRREAIERTVDLFPAKEPPKPVLENGTLMIVGGGRTPSRLLNLMVEVAGGKEARMVYIPCSESDQVAEPRAMLAYWKRKGVKSATWIHTKDRQKANSDEELLAALRNATGIWFGGGRQWNFVDSYYGTEAHRLMKDVLARGGVIGGSSAGASVLGRYMCRANPVANFDIMAPGYERGLGFIGGVAIDQHFSQRNRQKDMTQLADRYPQLLGLGIDESTAMVVSKSTAHIVGKGKVYFYDRTRPVVKGEPDYIALGSGAKYDLDKRKVLVSDRKPKAAETPPTKKTE